MVLFAATILRGRLLDWTPRGATASSRCLARKVSNAQLAALSPPQTQILLTTDRNSVEHEKEKKNIGRLLCGEVFLGFFCRLDSCS